MDRATISERNKKKIDVLHPLVQLKVGEYLAVCEVQLGVVMLVTDGYRTLHEQAELYAIGRTKPGRPGPHDKVTWVKPGGSFHQYGLSADIYPLLETTPGRFMINFDRQEPEGKAWAAYAEAMWLLVHPIAEQIGFGLLYNNQGLVKDPPHIQWTGGWTCSELLAAGYGQRPISEIPLPKPEVT